MNKARLIEKMAELVRDKRLEGITDIRDESDRHGMRIVVDVKKGESAPVILNNLYKHTQLQDTFGIIMLAIVDQRPRVLNILEACELFVDFRREVVRRRTAFELRKAEARAHILEGFAIALDHLDAVIALIRAARTPDDARQGLMATFALSELQAKAILDLQLQRLTGLERQKIVDELTRDPRPDRGPEGHPGQPRGASTGSSSRSWPRSATTTGTAAARRSWTRRTRSRSSTPSWTRTWPSRSPIPATSSAPRSRLTAASAAAGRGRMGMRTKDEDFVDQLFIASTHSYILIFTDRGPRVLAEGARDPRGRAPGHAARRWSTW